MPRQKIVSPAAQASVLYMDKTQYKAAIDSLMAQGLEHADAVDTLKVGIRQANGRPVPLQLLASAMSGDFAAA
jgi:hypothetical protein